MTSGIKKKQCIALDRAAHLRSSKQLHRWGLKTDAWESHVSLTIYTDPVEHTYLLPLDYLK